MVDAQSSSNCRGLSVSRHPQPARDRATVPRWLPCRKGTGSTTARPPHLECESVILFEEGNESHAFWNFLVWRYSQRERGQSRAHAPDRCPVPGDTLVRL